MLAAILTSVLLAAAPEAAAAAPVVAPAAAAAANTDEPRWLFFVMEGDGKERPPVVSRVMQYPGFESCQRLTAALFAERARGAFDEHLQARHKEHFAPGAAAAAQVIDLPEQPKETMNPYLATRAEASKRRSEWIKAQEEKGQKVVEATFTISCSQANRR